MSSEDPGKLRSLAAKAREEYVRLGFFEDDLVRPPVAPFSDHVLERGPLKVDGSILVTLLDERGSTASEIAHLREGIAAYRAHVARMFRNGDFSTSLVEGGMERVAEWERKDRER